MSTTQLFAASDLYAVIKERDKALAELEHGKPGVSIIIPCFEQSEYLPEALDSIDAQTVAPVEVLVIDDGSNMDEAVRIANLCGKHRCRYIRITNRGLPNARNTGLMLAKCKWVLFLDADDWLREDFIHKTLHEGEMTGADVVLTGIQEHGPHRHGTYQPGFDRHWTDVTVELLLNDYNRFYYASLFRRNTLREAGGYNGLMAGPYGKGGGYEDWDLTIDLMKRGVKYAGVEEPLFQYRTRSDGMLAAAERNRAELVAEIHRHHGV